MRDYRTHRPGTYEEMTSGFAWEVPASYNLAYPRKVEFVDDLPKTLTGKIRRSELRKQEGL